MNDFKSFDWNDPSLQTKSPEERQARTATPEAGEPPRPTSPPAAPVQVEPSAAPTKPVIPGSPLPLGVGILANKTAETDWEPVTPPVPPSPLPEETSPAPAAAPPVASVKAQAPRPSAPPGALSISEAPRNAPTSTFQRAVNVFRAAMPLMQRVLPLLDGNVGSAVSNLMAPRPQSAPPQPPVNLAPLESGLTRLQLQHRELREQVTEQTVSLRKVEDQLLQVREATDRNTLEQQELLEDLKSVGTRVNLFAYLALALLGLSVLLNAFLFFELRRFMH